MSSQVLLRYGLTDSSVSARAIGDMNANLLAQDTQQLRDARFKLAGMEPGVLGQATGLFGQIGQTYANQGNLALGQGIGQQNTLGSIGQTVGGLFGNQGAGTNLLQGFFNRGGNTSPYDPTTARGGNTQSLRPYHGTWHNNLVG